MLGLGALAFWALRPAMSPAPAEATDLHTPSPAAPRWPEPEVAEVARAAATTEPTEVIVEEDDVLPTPTRPTPTVFPASLDELPMTAWRAEQLARVEPVEVVLLDYKLGLLADMRECIAENVPDLGQAQVFLHFRRDPDTGELLGQGADLVDSSLSRESDPALLECIAGAHTGRAASALLDELDLPEGRDDFHWSVDLGLPLDRDDAYLWFVH